VTRKAKPVGPIEMTETLSIPFPLVTVAELGEVASVVLPGEVGLPRGLLPLSEAAAKAAGAEVVVGKGAQRRFLFPRPGKMPAAVMAAAILIPFIITVILTVFP